MTRKESRQELAVILMLATLLKVNYEGPVVSSTKVLPCDWQRLTY